MAKFVLIGYSDRAGYERTDAAVRDAAHTHDAADIDEAVALVSETPCAVAHGVVEVWPLDTT